MMADFSAILFSILHNIRSSGVETLLKKVSSTYGHLNSCDFIIYLLEIFRRFLTNDLFNTRKWVCYEASMLNSISSCLPVILAQMEDVGSNITCNSIDFVRNSRFVGTPCGMMWTEFIGTLCTFIRSPYQQVEFFDYRKLQISTESKIYCSDELIVLLYNTRLSFLRSSLPASYLTIVPDDFFTTILDFCNFSSSKVKVTSVDILYSCLKDSYFHDGDLKKCEAELINGLKSLITTNNYTDKSFSYLFSTLEKRFSEDVEDNNFFESAKSLIKMLRRFVKLLNSHLDVESTEHDDFISSLLMLIKFSTQNNFNHLLYSFSNELFKFHLNSENFIEAAMILKRHADDLNWDSKPVNSLFSGLHENNQLESKESIYLVCIQLFCQGGSYERAIHLSEKLREYYEATYQYHSQSDNLQFQASLYKRIMTEERFFPSYYRVIFHGKGFSKLNASSRQFIYKGNKWEQIGTFCERMRETHSCEIITNTAPVEDEIANGDGKYLQICAVQPAPDYRNWCRDENLSNSGMLSLMDIKRSEEIFPLWLHEPELTCENSADEKDKKLVLSKIENIPPSVASYYKQNELYTFACSRPIRKINTALQNHPAKEFLELYTEKILMYTDDFFPCHSGRSRIKKIISTLIKPIENAIITTRSKTKQLMDLKKKYSGAGSTTKRSSLVLLRHSLEGQYSPYSPSVNTLASVTTEPPPMNSSPFTLALKGAICAPVNGGIPMYKSAFLTDLNTAKESGATPALCEELQSAITEQAEVISGCLKLHANLVSPDLLPLHEEMVSGKIFS